MCSMQGLRISAFLHTIIGIFSICFGLVEIGDGVERYYHKVIPVPCLSIWMGFWFLVGGIFGGVLATRYHATRLKVLVIVYFFFSITSTVLAGVMTACYYLTINFWKYQDTHYPASYGITWVITILGGIEVVVSLWAFVCSWNIICSSSCYECCNIEVHPQTETFEGDLNFTSCSTSATNVFVLYGHDNVVIAAASGPNEDLDGTPEHTQMESNIRCEELPPSYEIALQNFNSITEISRTINIESVASGPNVDLGGSPENIQTRNKELPPTYEIAMQNQNPLTEISTTVDVNIESGALQYEGQPPSYHFLIENDSNTIEPRNFETLAFRSEDPPPIYQA